MVHLILTGATGLVGSAVLRSMLVNPNVTRITILSRRPIKQATGHEKANVILHDDFNNYSKIPTETFSDVHGCVWALGISQMAVEKKEYIAITRDYPLAFARFLSQDQNRKKPINFVYVSGEGATQEPTRFTQFFGVIKGETETELIKLGKEKESTLSVYSLRPGGVDASQQIEIHPYIPRPAIIMRFVSAILFPVMRVIYPAMISPTKELGDVLVKLAMSDGTPLEQKGLIGKEGRIISNIGFRVIAGLS